MPVYEEKEKINGQKRWFIRTYVTDESGNSKQVTRHNKNWIGRQGYWDAQQEEIRLKNSEIIKKKKERSITLHQLKEIYLDHLKNNVDKDTIKTKEDRLNHFCEIDTTKQVKTYPNINIKNYTKNMYIEFKQQMKSKKYTKKKNQKLIDIENGDTYSIKHLNKIHNEVCTMIDFAVNEGLCTHNFARQTGKIGTAKEVKLSNREKVFTVIDYNEYLRLMEVTSDNMKYNTIFDLWFTRGPRPGEIRAFQVKDFNYNKKQLMVNHTLSKSNELKDPKTASSKASIDLDNIVTEKINNLINVLKKETDFSDEWYIFGNKNMPISSHALNYNKDRYFKKANINKHLRLHDFRHSCATWLFSTGIPITVVSRILRHQDISTTMKTYTHLIEDDYQNALYKLNNLKIKQDQKQDQNFF